MKYFIGILLLFSISIYPGEKIFDFVVKDIRNNPFSMKNLKGKTVLIVNVASRCGYTPQYENLQNLYKKYKSKDFVILGFPSNDFGSQEPGTNREIAKFCKLKYNVDFPMMAKVKVKGKGKHKLFSYLLKNSSEKGEIQWNFEKFLIDKNGKVMKRFPSKISPESREFISFLESIL